VGFLPRPVCHSDLCDREKDIPPTKEDHRVQFFEHYRKEAEEYDRIS